MSLFLITVFAMIIACGDGAEKGSRHCPVTGKLVRIVNIPGIQLPLL
jgi:hypothetical protein